jgi:hypothetical protein
MAKQKAPGLGESLALRLLDPNDVDDEALGAVTNALGTSGREDSAALVREQPQAARLVSRIIGTAPVAGPATASPAGDTEVAESLYGARGRGKKKAGARLNV